MFKKLRRWLCKHEWTICQYQPLNQPHNSYAGECRNCGKYADVKRAKGEG